MNVLANQAGPLHGKLLPTGYELPQGLTYDEWAAEGPTLVTMAQSAMWWVGDWLTYGENHYGEAYAQAVEATGLAVQTLKNALWVASRIPPSERVLDVPYSHHRAVAALEPPQRRQLLAEARDEQLSEYDVRERVRALKGQSDGPDETVIDVPAEKSLGELLELALASLDDALDGHDWSDVAEARGYVDRARAAAVVPA